MAKKEQKRSSDKIPKSHWTRRRYKKSPIYKHSKMDYKGYTFGRLFAYFRSVSHSAINVCKTYSDADIARNLPTLSNSEQLPLASCDY
ncbi:hypothetical protein MAR_006262 [Mya arenaria]|uniref:Ribosomal protein L32 n=1 Tax=Mya arenaria TaxID=6604 RepID=A0ABY7D9M6_MYAAR|nr:hypothetical protein MAR_006262 [Mya arenaria]